VSDTPRAPWLALGVALCLLAGTADAGTVYYTAGVLEPDRVASAWLIARHVDPQAQVLLLAEDAEPPAGATPFDLPGAAWSRQASRSTYETILESSGLEDPALAAIGRLIRAGELAFWLLEPGSPDERFDRTLTDLTRDGDAEAAFAYLDRVYRNDGAVPEGR
jgi:hypothetical protein